MKNNLKITFHYFACRLIMKSAIIIIGLFSHSKIFSQSNGIPFYNYKALKGKIHSSQNVNLNSVIFTFEIIEDKNKTFGYNIFSDSKLIIHQPSIPALPGTNGFKTKIAAQKVAIFVISKIKNGEIPPTVSFEDMKNMDAFK